MIAIDFCELPRQPATGLRYVRVRFSWEGHEQFDGQMRLETWRAFMGLLKPSMSLLTVTEIPLERWR